MPIFVPQPQAWGRQLLARRIIVGLANTTIQRPPNGSVRGTKLLSRLASRYPTRSIFQMNDCSRMSLSSGSTSVGSRGEASLPNPRQQFRKVRTTAVLGLGLWRFTLSSNTQMAVMRQCLALSIHRHHGAELDVTRRYGFAGMFSNEIALPVRHAVPAPLSPLAWNFMLTTSLRGARAARRCLKTYRRFVRCVTLANRTYSWANPALQRDAPQAGFARSLRAPELARSASSTSVGCRFGVGLQSGWCRNDSYRPWAISPRTQPIRGTRHEHEYLW